VNIAIVIPTYNEKENLHSLIEKIFDKIRPLVDELHVVIVDDSSPDGTADIARNLGEKFQKISVIQRPAKMGLGAAYKDGFTYVLQKLESNLVVQMDADHSHNPSELANMIEKIVDYDFIIASRHVPGSSIVGWNSRRKITHSIAGAIAKVSANIDIDDCTSGFRMFKRDALEKIEFNKIEADGFAFQIEVLYQLKQKGLHGLEVPTTFVNRTEGESKMGNSEVIQFIRMCLSYIGKK
jgi:dolichol-phosphate mannosyltransferase